MSLRERLDAELKSAMKSKDVLKLSVIRMIRSSVKNREIELHHELDDLEITEILSTLGKQRRESIRLFKEADRQDLVVKEEKELEVLLEFLPQQLSREEIEALVDQVILDCGAQGSKDMGKVMKLLVTSVTGRADGKMVSEVVRGKLA